MDSFIGLFITNGITKHELQSNLRSYLKTLQNKPHHVQKFFEAEDVKYAA